MGKEFGPKVKACSKFEPLKVAITGFFCVFSQKLKVKKKSSDGTSQGFSYPKLNVPVVSCNLFHKTSGFVTKIEDFFLKNRENLTFEAKMDWTNCKVYVLLQVI